MSDVLPFVPLPRRWENIHGYLRRLAAANGIGQLNYLRRVTGLREIAASQSDASLRPLSEITGLPLDRFDHMRWRPVGNRQHVMFMGHPVRISVLSAVRMRFCPSCLAEEGADHHRILRSTWSLFHVTACPHHRTMLVDTCDAPGCNRPFQHRSSSAPWACACGRLMTDVKTRPAPPDAVRAALALTRAAGALHGSGRVMLSRDGDLPPAFQNMSLDALSTVLEHLGRIEALRSSGDVQSSAGKIRRSRRAPVDQSISIEARSKMLGAAFRILDGWPGTWHAILDDHAVAEVTISTGKSFLSRLFPTKVGRLLIDQVRDADGKSIRPFENELASWLRDRHGFDMSARTVAPMIAHMARTGTTALNGTLSARATMDTLHGDPQIHAPAFGAWLETGLLTPCSETANGDYKEMRFNVKHVADLVGRTQRQLR